MRILINNLARPELEQTSFSLTQQASDPIPTCTFTLRDEASSIPISSFQEVVVIDETAYPLPPTHNFLINPVLNPYNSDGWTTSANSGISLAQHGGGGIDATFSNAPVSVAFIDAQQVPTPSLSVPQYYVQPNQTYTFSCTVVGSGLSHVQAYVEILWTTVTGVTTGSGNTSHVPTGSPTTISVTATAPAGTAFATVYIGAFPTNATNSGTITYTQAQFEANWFPELQSYPSAYCDGTQANTYTMPDGTSIREKRLFGGWVTDYEFVPVAAGSVVRDIHVGCSAYGWLFDKRTNNSVYTTIQDDAMITNLVSTYFTGRFTSNHVVAAPLTISVLQYSYDNLRKVMDDICNLTGQRWFVDAYADVWYVPQQYKQAGYGLTDSSPDDITTFIYSSYRHKFDFTQPTNRTLVKINVPTINTTAPTTIAPGSVVVTPADMTNISIGTLLDFHGGTGVTETVTVTAVTLTTFTATFSAAHSGAYLITNNGNRPALGMALIEHGQARAIYGAVFEKYVDDSQIVDQGMAHTRGLAENLQYSYARETITLELDEQASQSQIAPGVSIQITSTNEGVIARSYLIQKVTITILASGDATLRTRYKYALELGAYNSNLENMLIKNFKQATSSSSLLPNPTAQWNMAGETLYYNETVTHTP